MSNDMTLVEMMQGCLIAMREAGGIGFSLELDDGSRAELIYHDKEGIEEWELTKENTPAVSNLFYADEPMDAMCLMGIFSLMKDGVVKTEMIMENENEL